MMMPQPHHRAIEYGQGRLLNARILIDWRILAKRDHRLHQSEEYRPNANSGSSTAPRRMPGEI